MWTWVQQVLIELYLDTIAWFDRQIWNGEGVSSCFVIDTIYNSCLLLFVQENTELN